MLRKCISISKRMRIITPQDASVSASRSVFVARACLAFLLTKRYQPHATRGVSSWRKKLPQADGRRVAEALVGKKRFSRPRLKKIERETSENMAGRLLFRFPFLTSYFLHLRRKYSLSHQARRARLDCSLKNLQKK